MMIKKNSKTYQVIHRVFDFGWYDFFVNDAGQDVVIRGSSHTLIGESVLGYGVVNKGYIAVLTGSKENGGVLLMRKKKCNTKYHDFVILGVGAVQIGDSRSNRAG